MEKRQFFWQKKKKYYEFPWWMRLASTVWSVAWTAVKVAFGAALVALAVICITSGVFAYMLGNYLQEDVIPNADFDVESFDLDQSSFIYYLDSDNNIKELQQINTTIDRVWATYDEIPQDMVHAAVAIEDKRFFQHQGVDWFTTTKACFNMFLGSRSTFGGSTITQQLIKNLTQEDDVTVRRKVLEIFRALQFEERYTKEEVMEWYLNTIYNEIFLGEEIPFEYEAMFAPARHEGDQRYSVITVPYDNIPGWGYFVNADVKNPELICSYLDTVISKDASMLYNWGVEGETFATNENGSHYFLDGYTDSAARKTAGVGNIMDVRYIQYKLREVDYVGGTDASRAAYDKIIGGLLDGTLTGIRALRGTPSFTAEQSETIARSTTPMKTYIDENVMYFIDGTRDMGEWDAFVAETLALGNMDEVLATYEAADQVIYSTERRYVSYN